MQAAFIILAYNLAQLLNDEIQNEDSDEGQSGAKDHATLKKRVTRLADLKDKLNHRREQLPLLREVYQKPCQLCVKFYRWLRSHLYDPSPWPESYARLTLIYNKF